MAGENYILHYVNSDAFKNFNQIFGTFESRVHTISMILGMFPRNLIWTTPLTMKRKVIHISLSIPCNDSRYVAIDSVKSIIPQKTDDTFAVLSLNIQSIAAKFDSFLSFLSYLDENNINFNAICLQET